MRTIARVAGIAAGVTAVAGAGLAAALRRPLPRVRGTLRLPGLSAPVQVIRDRWGVPHIYAASGHDLFMAQGFVHAQERLWQMEFQRRVGHGRLAEVFGPIALDSDRFVRILGFSRVARAEADALDDETRAALEAYAAGVNTYIAQAARRLPIEFTLLRLRPEPWRIADTLVWARVMALGLSENWRQEIVRARLVAALGEERAAELEPDYREDHPLIVPPGLRYSPGIGQSALDLAEGVERFQPNGSGQGSNNWVVSGARAAGGAPLLANDPHLQIAFPSLWYENHLSGGGYHVTGASLPGSPGVIIGHNERVAWGVTNGMTDVQDLYVERFDPADPLRYEYRGGWETAELVREEIHVRGQAAPVVEEVRVTRHGPVITPLIPGSEGERENGRANGRMGEQPAPETLAMRWTALDRSTLPRAILRINRARDWESFRAALADWDVPAQNFVYADVEGHIGYALGGRLPVRAAGDGRLPVPGWTGEYEWTGFIPNAELPHALDPDEGFAVTANNRIVGDDFPHQIGGEWLNGYRAARIRQLIEQIPRHTTESFARIQGDQRSLPGLELAALAGRLPAETPLARRAREVLATWDGSLTAESAAGLIFTRMRDRLLDAAFAEAAPQLDIVVGLGAHAIRPGKDFINRALPQTLRRIASREDAWLPGARTWDALLAETWAATLAELSAEQGPDPAAWRYGRAHTITVRHALGSIPALAPLLNRGPFPIGGDFDTVFLGHEPRRTVGLPIFIAPSYRQICDTGDWNRSRSIHPTGQSGHPADRHYDDFLRPWLRVEHHPMLWSRAMVEEAAAARLTLRP